MPRRDAPMTGGFAIDWHGDLGAGPRAPQPVVGRVSQSVACMRLTSLTVAVVEQLTSLESEWPCHPCSVP